MSRARVVDATGASAPVEIVDGTVDVTGSPLAAAGEGPRLLVLAERAGVTSAHVDGRALEEADPVDGWAQAYVLPGGDVSVDLSASPAWYRVLVVGGWILVLVSAVVAVPIGRGGRR